jgi:hypothetical protein
MLADRKRGLFNARPYYVVHGGPLADHRTSGFFIFTFSIFLNI